MDRNEAIAEIKTALEQRSGKRWSVTGGRGTAWGWLKIDAPPSRRTWRNRPKAGGGPDDYEEYNGVAAGYGHMSPDDRKELGELLALDAPAHFQGVSIPSSNQHYEEYVCRAATGQKPSKLAVAYWD